MSYRFFLDSEIIDGQTVLAGDQAHHAQHVMRYKTGDSILLFDGRGGEWKAQIVEASKKRLDLTILESIQRPASSARSVTIATALPKGDRQKFLIEKLVELGVSSFYPLKTERSVAVANSNVIQRFCRHAIEATKQCGRSLLMQIEQQQTVDQFLLSSQTIPERVLADPYADSSLASLAAGSQAPMVIAIGPEGGFTVAENIAFEDAGWQRARFSGNILRIETACLAAAVLALSE